jgi:hypothetical protein
MGDKSTTQMVMFVRVTAPLTYGTELARRERQQRARLREERASTMSTMDEPSCDDVQCKEAVS